MRCIGLAWSWWLTLGTTEGYDQGTEIFWLGPVGFILERADD